MARNRSIVRKRKRKKKLAMPKRLQMHAIAPQAMSVDQFCHAHNISRDTFYALLKDDLAPECMKIGTRRLISFESASRWRAKREQKEVVAA